MTPCSLVSERNSVPKRARAHLLGLLFALVLLPVSARHLGAQDGVVAGTVLDASSRRPIASARILVPGTQRGTVTDTDSRFRIQGLPGGTVTLQVRRLGYRPFTETAQVGRTDLQLLLNELPQLLGELVVTGTATRPSKNAPSEMRSPRSTRLASSSSPRHPIYRIS